MGKNQYVEYEEIEKQVIGKRFGKLYTLPMVFVKDVVDTNDKRLSRRSYHIKCQCDCGNIIYPSKESLLAGNVNSCGCVNSENLVERNKKNKKYNDSDSQPTSEYYHLYNSWFSMISRCTNKDNKAYKYYGGRGITVFDNWFDYNQFKEWALNNGWSKELTIDRIDVDGNYEPSNCKWSTNIEQANNMRSNLQITYRGKTQTLSMWCRELDLPYETIKCRLKSPKFTTIEDAFEKPIKYNRVNR